MAPNARIRPPAEAAVFDLLSGLGQDQGGGVREKQIVTARIQRADKYRLFVVTDLGLSGGVHVEFLDAEGGRVENADEWLSTEGLRPRFDAKLAIDEVVECAVLKVDHERFRIELSRRDDDVFFPQSAQAFYDHYGARGVDFDPALDASKMVRDYVSNLSLIHI